MLENKLFYLIIRLNIHYIPIIKKQLLAVSGTQQGRQREPSVKTLLQFWKHCMLSGGTKRRPLPRHQSEEIEI